MDMHVGILMFDVVDVAFQFTEGLMVALLVLPFGSDTDGCLLVLTCLYTPVSTSTGLPPRGTHPSRQLLPTE